jgi:hypothetical protein
VRGNVSGQVVLKSDVKNSSISSASAHSGRDVIIIERVLWYNGSSRSLCHAEVVDLDLPGI